MTDIEIRHTLCGLSADFSMTLNKLPDKIQREGCIYALLCVIKQEHPEDFENALIFYLKEGVK